MNYGLATDAVIRVGAGRGFVVKDMEGRYIITAAHCLPHFPPCAAFSHTEERTYARLLGLIGSRPSVWTECVFVNPIADIAVLGSPDDQQLYAEAQAYEQLTGNIRPLRVTELPRTGPDFRIEHARLLSLDRKWFDCKVRYRDDSSFWIFDAAQDIRGGMSGSPILSPAGSAIGVMCSSMGRGTSHHREGGPNPVLARDLPRGILRQLDLREASKESRQRRVSQGLSKGD